MALARIKAEEERKAKNMEYAHRIQRWYNQRRHHNMKKVIALAIATFALFGCGPQTLYAQSAPTTLTLAWNPNPVTDAVTSYEVTIDNGAPIVVPPTINAQGLVTVIVPVATFGHHIISLIAKSVSIGCDDPTQCSTGIVQSSAPTTLGFTLASAPITPRGPKLSKP